MQRCTPTLRENTAGHVTTWGLEYAQTIKQQQQAPEAKPPQAHQTIRQ